MSERIFAERLLLGDEKDVHEVGHAEKLRIRKLDLLKLNITDLKISRFRMYDVNDPTIKVDIASDETVNATITPDHINNYDSGWGSVNGSLALDNNLDSLDKKGRIQLVVLDQTETATGEKIGNQAVIKVETGTMYPFTLFVNGTLAEPARIYKKATPKGPADHSNAYTYLINTGSDIPANANVVVKSTSWNGEWSEVDVSTRDYNGIAWVRNPNISYNTAKSELNEVVVTALGPESYAKTVYEILLTQNYGRREELVELFKVHNYATIRSHYNANYAAKLPWKKGDLINDLIYFYRFFPDDLRKLFEAIDYNPALGLANRIDYRKDDDEILSMAFAMPTKYINSLNKQKLASIILYLADMPFTMSRADDAINYLIYNTNSSDKAYVLHRLGLDKTIALRKKAEAGNVSRSDINYIPREDVLNDGGLTQPIVGFISGALPINKTTLETRGYTRASRSDVIWQAAGKPMAVTVAPFIYYSPSDFESRDIGEILSDIIGHEETHLEHEIQMGLPTFGKKYFGDLIQNMIKNGGEFDKSYRQIDDEVAAYYAGGKLIGGFFADPENKKEFDSIFNDKTSSDYIKALRLEILGTEKIAIPENERLLNYFNGLATKSDLLKKATESVIIQIEGDINVLKERAKDKKTELQNAITGMMSTSKLRDYENFIKTSSTYSSKVKPEGGVINSPDKMMNVRTPKVETFTITGHSENLWNEFVTGFGPQNSVFLEDHPVSENLKARLKDETERLVYLLYQSHHGELKEGDSFTNSKLPFGLLDTIKYRDNLNMEFIGTATLSAFFYQGQIVVLLADSKDMYSLIYHVTEAYDHYRQPGKERYGTTYQYYFWNTETKDINWYNQEKKHRDGKGHIISSSGGSSPEYVQPFVSPFLL